MCHKIIEPLVRLILDNIKFNDMCQCQNEEYSHKVPCVNMILEDTIVDEVVDFRWKIARA